MVVVAIDSGDESGTYGECQPWIFPADDLNDYYTKYPSRCAVPDFREAELLASRLGRALGAHVPHCEPIFIPDQIAEAAGLDCGSEWAIGSRKESLVFLTPTVFRPYAAARPVEERLRIVVLHTWLDVGDHGPGHNFMRHVPSDRLVSLDHAQALEAFRRGDVAVPTLVDPAGLLAGVDLADESCIKDVADDLASIGDDVISTTVAEFPKGAKTPWIEGTRAAELIEWLVARKEEVIRVLDP